jgi:RNA polymerase sigma-70 factor (ECF subfamily)
LDALNANRLTHRESTALLREARQGSRDALGALYTRYGGRLLAYIRIRMGRALRVRIESRDILQATFMKSFQRLEQFEGADGASLMGWLARIAENEIRDQVDFQHRQRRDVAAAVPLDDAAAQVPATARSALSEAVLNEQADCLTRALDGLDPDHREVIVLRKLEELSFKDVASRLGRSEDACRMLLARAMAALTLKLKGMS